MNTEQHSNEFLARVYGAYIGCDFIRTPSTIGNGIGKVSNHTIGSIIAGDRQKKLLLTPLSDITDEDAIEAAKICFPKKSNHDDAEWVRLGKAIAALNRPKSIKSIDYLRSKGYDCGFAHIPSLIDAGIAIKKELDVKL